MVKPRRTWFTADTHFGHANLITRGLRKGYSSIVEHDRALMGRWNETVSDHDEVYHLGDFTMLGADEANNYRQHLNGRIHLIHGNHDQNAVRKLSCWESSRPFAEINLDGHSITLCHYALRVWNKSHHGSLHFYGHSHGSLPGTTQSIDVGVDTFGRPVSLTTLIGRMSAQAPYKQKDHHL